MKKINKYGLIIALVVVLIIALIIGLIKFVNSKKEVEVSKLENAALQEEDEIVPVNVDEAQNEENTQVTEEELPKDEEQPKETTQEEKKETTDIPYYIKINNQANVVTIYTKDENGNYTVPYKAMICSIGTATPSAGNIYTIPGGKAVRGWDPTDPDVNNPWRSYVRPTEKIPESIAPCIPVENPKVEEAPATQEKPTEPIEPTTLTKTEEPEKLTESEAPSIDKEVEPTNPTDSEASSKDEKIEPTKPTEPENSIGDDKEKNITSNNEE